MSLSPGAKVGAYEIRAELGAGGMGVVDVFPVHHFHDAKFRWGSTTFASAVVNGLFVTNQFELSGNVWMTTLRRQ